jgi:hypothetical protein
MIGTCIHGGNDGENGHVDHNKSLRLPRRIICMHGPLMNEFTGISKYVMFWSTSLSFFFFSLFVDLISKELEALL